jgi:hypothetical protein
MVMSVSRSSGSAAARCRVRVRERALAAHAAAARARATRAHARVVRVLTEPLRTPFTRMNAAPAIPAVGVRNTAVYTSCLYHRCLDEYRWRHKTPTTCHHGAMTARPYAEMHAARTCGTGSSTHAYIWLLPRFCSLCRTGTAVPSPYGELYACAHSSPPSRLLPSAVPVPLLTIGGIAAAATGCRFCFGLPVSSVYHARSPCICLSIPLYDHDLSLLLPLLPAVTMATYARMVNGKHAGAGRLPDGWWAFYAAHLR